MPEGLGGVAVSAAYRPADGPAAGGDFYDVFTLGEERVCVLLGDVSGHGRESVTQAALARYTLRTLLAAGHPPAEALARADVLLARELQPNFVTVIAGIYDPATGELTYAKAGHAPPIVLGTAHDPDAEEPAPPLGLGVDGTWPEYRVRLGEGVSVCLFTDGLADAQVGDTRIGRAEVERMLAAHDVPDAGRLIGDLEGMADHMARRHRRGGAHGPSRFISPSGRPGSIDAWTCSTTAGRSVRSHRVAVTSAAPTCGSARWPARSGAARRPPRGARAPTARSRRSSRPR